MAAAAIEIGVNVIGLVSGILGVIQFTEDHLPSHNGDGSDSALRVGLGLDSINNSNAQGPIRHIKLYDENRNIIGAGSGSSTISDGGFQDINIQQRYGPSKQPTYIQVNAADDGVCIAYLTQTWPDGQQRSWLGDIGRLCGANWQYSNVFVNDDNYQPMCTWIDQNHDGGVGAAALQIHMVDFNKNAAEAYSEDPADYCSWPTMFFSPSTEEQGMPDNQLWGSPTDKGSLSAIPSKRRRAIKKRSSALASTIIGSKNPSHSAKELCDSTTSYGSDFVSFNEEIFCDMETKTSWPLCSDSVKDDCYEWDTHTLIDAGGHTAKNYDNVQNW